MKKNKNGLSIIILMALYVVFVNMIGFLMTKIGLDIQRNMAAFAVQVIIIETGLIAIVYYLVTKEEKKKCFFKEVGLNRAKKGTKEFLIGGLISVSFWLVFIIIGISQGMYKFQSISLNRNQLLSLAMTIVLGMIISGFAAFGEELMFRGYLLKKFENKRGIIFAIILSSLLFSLCHTGKYIVLLQFLSAFSTGILFSILYIKFKSLWVPIGVHIVHNFISLSIIGDGTSKLVSTPLLNFKSIPYEINVGTFYLGNFDHIIMIAYYFSVAIAIWMFVKDKNIMITTDKKAQEI